MKTVPAPHIPTPAHPLSTPRLPSNTGPTIPAPAFRVESPYGVRTIDGSLFVSRVIRTDGGPMVFTKDEALAFAAALVEAAR